VYVMFNKQFPGYLLSSKKGNFSGGYKFDCVSAVTSKWLFFLQSMLLILNKSVDWL